MKSDTPVGSKQNMIIKIDAIPVKQISMVDNTFIDPNKITLTESEKHIATTLATKEFGPNNTPEKQQFTQHVTTMIIAAKAHGIRPTIENIAAVAGIWKIESSYQIDTKKEAKDVRAQIKKIKAKIDSIQTLLNDDGDKYFDSKIQQLEQIVNSSRQ